MVVLKTPVMLSEINVERCCPVPSCVGLDGEGGQDIDRVEIDGRRSPR